MNKKRNKDRLLVKDRSQVGRKKIELEQEEGDPVSIIVQFRSRKARRANARLNNVDWRSLSEFDKLSY